MLIVTGTAMVVTGAFLLGFRVGYLLGYVKKCMEMATWEDLSRSIMDELMDKHASDNGEAKPC